MRKKQDWEIKASTALNVTNGTPAFSLKLKGLPFKNINSAHRARDDIIVALKLLDYVKEHDYRGFSQHEIQYVLRGLYE